MRTAFRAGMIVLNILLFLVLMLYGCGCKTYPPSKYHKIDVDGKISYLLKSEIVPFSEEDYENMEIALNVIKQIDPRQGGWVQIGDFFWMDSSKYDGLTIGVNKDINQRYVFINKNKRITSVNYFLGNFIHLGAVCAHELHHRTFSTEDPKCGKLTDERIYGILSTNLVEVDFNGGKYKVGHVKF